MNDTDNTSEPVGELIFRARRQGVQLALDGDRIAATFSGEPDPALVAALKQHGDGLKAFLADRDGPASDVVARIGQIAATRPGHLALTDGATHMTYAELWRDSDRLAGRLAAAGVAPETRVGVLIERGCAWIVAMLAVLKTRATYVALSAKMPTDMIAGCCADGTIELLLVSGTAKDQMDGNGLDGVACLVFGQSDDSVADFRPAPIDPGLAAYMIFTSGSTGKPKPVVVEHRALDNLVTWHSREYATADADVRATQLASATFDAHIWEIFPYLCSGATVRIVDEATRLDMGKLARLLAQEAITHTFLPTPLAEAFMSMVDGSTLPAVRFLLTGGDALKRTQWHGTARLVNHYGPTEGAVVATSGYVDGGDGLPPIGLPIDGVRTTVLDEDGHRVAVSGLGNLHIAGRNLARVYFGDPRATAASFVPDPASADGQRMYRTGDIVWEHGDGQLQYVSRIDAQIKVRGIRIEPAEVERAILSTQSVTDACVVKSATRDNTLVAFVAMDADASPDEDPDSSVGEWSALYDDVYAGGREDEFTGWNSSYDGTPIERGQMRSWAQATADRILRYGRNRKVFELGVGSGILLTRLAAEVQSYQGCDLSSRGIDWVRNRVQRELPDLASSICLDRAAAHEIDAGSHGKHDMVIVNSVVQYFPDRAYLENVLDAVYSMVNPGGVLFIGDVRDFRLQPVFLDSVQRFNDQQGHHDGRTGDDELFVDPALFFVWAQARQLTADIRVLPKNSPHDNELSRFRYDVVIHRREPQPVHSPGQRHDWIDERLSINEAELLSLSDLDSFVIERIPYVDDPTLVFELTRIFEDRDWSTEAILNGQPAGHFALQVFKREAGPPAAPAHDSMAADRLTSSPRRHDQRIVAAIRGQLADSLPGYMVPDLILVRDRLPLTDNGKVDRRALERAPLPSSESDYVAPVTPLERVVERWLAEALEVEGVSRNSDFFDLGGNSLRAIRLIGKVNEELGIDIPVHFIFDNPSVEKLAMALTQLIGDDDAVDEIVQLLEEKQATAA